MAGAVGELAVPIVGEKTDTTPWHPHHITERYGQFVLILLGDSLLALANAIIGALREGANPTPLISIAASTPSCRWPRSWCSSTR